MRKYPGFILTTILTLIVSWCFGCKSMKSHDESESQIASALNAGNIRSDANNPPGASIDVTFLKNDNSLNVATLNLDGRGCTMAGRGESCPKNSGSFDAAVKKYKALHSKDWDIVGVQELDSKKGNFHSETEEFRTILGNHFNSGKPFSCVEQTAYSNDFYAAICSRYPIVEGSKREKVIYHWLAANGINEQSRVMLCAQFSTPAGIITACTTHTRHGSNEPAQFRDGENFIFSDAVLKSYIPKNVDPQSYESFLIGLRGSLILTGDMNTDVKNIRGRFQSACAGGIDQVMNVDMSHDSFGHTAAYRDEFLVADIKANILHKEEGWPTDHEAPCVALFNTRELKIPIHYTGADSQNPVDDIVVATPPVATNTETANQTTSEIIYRTCESQNFKVSKCLIKEGIHSAAIGSYVALSQAQVSKKLSNSECKNSKESSSGHYFLDHACAQDSCSLSIIVNRGCRAKFRVQLPIP